MIWWILGAIALCYLLWIVWKGLTHPSHVLGKQAANMNWVAAGRTKDDQGYNNVHFSRNGLEAMVSFSNGNVELVSPQVQKPFKDFIEIEHYLLEQGLVESSTVRSRSSNAIDDEPLAGACKEVRDTCAAIEAQILDNRATSIVKEQALERAKIEERTQPSIQEGGLTPEALANMLITNVIADTLGTGRYHIYRGVLNQIGNDMVLIWDHAVELQEKLGEYTSAQAQEDKDWLREQIKLIG